MRGFPEESVGTFSRRICSFSNSEKREKKESPDATIYFVSPQMDASGRESTGNKSGRDLQRRRRLGEAKGDIPAFSASTISFPGSLMVAPASGVTVLSPRGNEGEDRFLQKWGKRNTFRQNPVTFCFEGLESNSIRRYLFETFFCLTGL